MKIIGLQITNLRLIKAIDLAFSESGLIQIRGKNKQGKSTILNAFEMLFKGKKSIPKDVVTHGEKRARIIGQVGEYTIQRDIEGDDSKIKVVGLDGKPVTSSPQEFLDSFVNELTFNPRPFIDKSGAEKLKFLMDVLKIDFSEIDETISFKEKERLHIGRTIKELGTPKFLPKVEAVEKDTIYLELRAAQEENLQRNQIERQIEHNTEKILRLEQNLEDLEEQLDLIKEKIIDTKEHCGATKVHNHELSMKLSEMGELKPIEAIEQKLKEADETNKAALEYEKDKELHWKIEALKHDYDNFTLDINHWREEKKKILKSTKMPVDGLEIREDGVYFDGIHADNWSDSENISISFNLCVAMNPELKAVFIDKGESYDESQLKVLDEWAKANDIQAFITIVDSGPVGGVEDSIYIVDGQNV